MVTEECKDLIRSYLVHGHSSRLIHYLLKARHSYMIRYSYLKRKVIPSIQLKKVKDMEDIDDFAAKLLKAIRDGCGGAEDLRRAIAMKYSIALPRQLSREIMRQFDANGVKRRSRRRLRRVYINKGPNYVWHLDGYDKLSPFGVCIHGCIDGFSRKLIWLEADVTNKRPEVVASYFVQVVQTEKVHPVKIRADPGTENGVVASMQRALSNSEAAFIYGSSTHNQRVERFWGYLRQTWSDFWIDHFKILEGDGYFIRGNPVHRYIKDLVLGCKITTESMACDKTDNVEEIKTTRHNKMSF